MTLAADNITYRMSARRLIKEDPSDACDGATETRRTAALRSPARRPRSRHGRNSRRTALRGPPAEEARAANTERATRPTGAISRRSARGSAASICRRSQRRSRCTSPISCTAAAQAAPGPVGLSAIAVYYRPAARDRRRHKVVRYRSCASTLPMELLFSRAARLIRCLARWLAERQPTVV